jgi:zeaxanthin glucosyltransferase
MAHILTVSAGLASVIYPSLELGRRLAAAGHRVDFAGPEGYRELAEGLGLRFRRLDPGRYAEFLDADRDGGMLNRLWFLRRRRAYALESTATDAFIRLLRAVDPDLLLINGEMHEHIIAAQGAGAPTVLINTFASIWRRPGLPPPHHAVRPGVGWKGTPIGTRFLWLLLRLRKWSRAVTRCVRDVGCDRLSILRRLASEARFDLRRETDASQWLIPFAYRHIPVLSVHALEFEFPHQPPPHVHYVGPMVLQVRDDRSFPPADRAALQEIVDRRQQGGDRRLIYAAFGSAFSTDVSLLQRLFRSVAERPDWELVVSLSQRMTPPDPRSLPERVHVFPWMPQVAVLEHADAMVTHGGIHTIDECVLSGVPMLVYCGFQTDMGGNTARVLHHGIGIAGDTHRDEPETIRRHLDRLLHDDHVKEHLDRLKRAYLAYAEHRVAESTIDDLLDRISRRSSTAPPGPAGPHRHA